MPRPRPFPYTGSQTGVFHVVSRVAGREFPLGDDEKEFFTRTLHAYAELLGVQVLTHCTMSNHFHILLRVPERPAVGTGEAGTGPTVGALLTRLESAVGAEQMRQIRKNLELWEQNGAHDLIEKWRQRQIAVMYSLSEYMKRVKQRFTRWYNKRTGRVGIFWEDRYRSTIVQDENKALRMMATYIDLNPVRAGLTDDPGTYRWSGYAEAMAGKANAKEGLARITGATVERVLGQGLGQPAPVETPAQCKRRQIKALVHYRQMLGMAGRPRTREDGKVSAAASAPRCRPAWSAKPACGASNCSSACATSPVASSSAAGNSSTNGSGGTGTGLAGPAGRSARPGRVPSARHGRASTTCGSCGIEPIESFPANHRHRFRPAAYPRSARLAG